MYFGWTNVNLLDLWMKPEFNSERGSQLMFGSVIRIGQSKNNYYKITEPDGYNGWADKRFIKLINKKDYDKIIKSTKKVIISKQAKIYNASLRTSVSPYYLYYGTKVIARSQSNGYSEIILPDTEAVYIKSNNIGSVSKKNSMIKSEQIISEAKKFLGTPYLWGGVTTAGFDCSGLVQTILSRYGISFPRDTKDQIKVGSKISRENIKSGDLLFFKRHIGFAIGGDKIIHSSAGGNGVRINSLNTGQPDYREDLDRDFNQARRLKCIS